MGDEQSDTLAKQGALTVHSKILPEPLVGKTEYRCVQRSKIQQSLAQPDRLQEG